MAAGVTWGKNTTFGASSATTASASSTSTGFSFGSTAPSTPTSSTSLFGSNTVNAGSTPATKSAFGFGASTPAPAPTTSLFGSTTPTTPAASGTSLFGSTATPTSLFGQTAQVQQQQQLYAATPAQAALQAQMYAQQLQEASHIESSLSRLHEAYSSTPPAPTNTDANIPFHHIAYDVISTQTQSHYPAYPPRPTYVSPSKWSEALARNPNTKEYQPVSLLGVEPLSTRLSQQQTKANTYKKAMVQLSDTYSALLQSHENSKQRIEYYRMQERNIRTALMQVLKKVEILRCRNIPLQPAERELYNKFSGLAIKLRQSMDELRMVQDLALGYIQTKDIESRKKDRMGDFTSQSRTMTEEEKRHVSILLEEQRIGLEKLVEVVKKDGRDTEIMKQECLLR